jgi:hypothetical protein
VDFFVESVEAKFKIMKKIKCSKSASVHLRDSETFSAEHRGREGSVYDRFGVLIST